MATGKGLSDGHARGDARPLDVAEAWSLGPKRSEGTPRFHPLALALASIGVVAVVASILVQVAGPGEYVSPDRTATAANPVAGSPILPEAVAPSYAAAASREPATPPVRVTDLRLTDGVDAVTGDPGGALEAFAADETVRLWFSFEAWDLSRPLTVVWLRQEKSVARLTAPLPGAASQMVFPLPDLAAERAGLYRVEIRSDGDVLAAETFEVTDV